MTHRTDRKLPVPFAGGISRRGLLKCVLCALALQHVYDGRTEAAEPPYKTKYRVIDMHCHCPVASEPALLAHFAVMDEVGIDALVILDGDSPRGSLPVWLELQQKYPRRLAVFAKIDFSDVKQPTFFDDLVQKLERQAQQGIQGVKVWKDLGMSVRDASGRLLAVDDPRLDPFWAKCGELRLPVALHTADPKEYWHPLTYHSIHYGLRTETDQHYHNPEMPSWDELMRQRDHVLEKHPRTNFIGNHLGSLEFDLERLGQTFEKYPNFFVDCAARLRMLGRLNPPAVRDFFTRYQDRLLFGTDIGILRSGEKVKRTSANITIYPSENPNTLCIDPADADALRKWQDRVMLDYAEWLQYFETDRVDLVDPTHSGGAWLRIFGAKLPDAVLEKFYHANAERLVPALAVPQSPGG